MSEYILNLLPLKEGEREEFEIAAPEAKHVYARSSTVTPEQLAAATVIFGWPRAEALKQAFTGPVTPQVPASILQLHPYVTLVADKAAMSKMEN